MNCIFCQSVLPPKESEGHPCAYCNIFPDITQACNYTNAGNQFATFQYRDCYKVIATKHHHQTYLNIRLWSPGLKLHVWKTAMELPGFPITPQNAPNKIPLYLTFS